MDLAQTLAVAAAGLRAQGERLRVVAENIANADSVSIGPNGQPYRRQIVTFKDVLDHETGVGKVAVDRVRPDTSPLRLKYEPGHPDADSQGYVHLPNVNTLIEMTDMREAQRSYDANLKVIEVTHAMVARTLSLLQ
ncbi:MAG TPA: flagellar basal body rod protein FlgC [Dongiaceae bacterium]|jgi:flagellar basal-body rod protein FlgC|nr:flagellar basal body rod protein FlgC [Dongiaceae bacterium]